MDIEKDAFLHQEGFDQSSANTQCMIGDNSMSLEYNKMMIPRAKALRQPMTKQERHLWYDFLSGYVPRFQRQKTIGSYIVDFYCHEAKLVIELDGAQHYEENAKGYDAARTQFLNAAGIEVLRFPNAAVEQDCAGVCRAIDHAVKQRMSNRRSE